MTREEGIAVAKDLHEVSFLLKSYDERIGFHHAVRTIRNILDDENDRVKFEATVHALRVTRTD
jgi:hypothetical protein